MNCAARNGRLRPTLGIVITYIGVSLLHAGFDSFGSIAGYAVISVIGIAPLVTCGCARTGDCRFVGRPRRQQRRISRKREHCLRSREIVPCRPAGLSER